MRIFDIIRTIPANHQPSPEDKVLMQIYTSAWGGGLLGIRDRINYLKIAGIGGVVTSPVGKYDGIDGPYSPVVNPNEPFEVDKRFGGTASLLEMNTALRENGIRTYGDMVGNHMFEGSEQWQRALSGDSEAAKWFRLFKDPKESNFLNKVNIFNEQAYIWVPELGMYRSSTFYRDQIEYDIAAPEVRGFLAGFLRHMLDSWFYDGARYDAIAYSGTRTIATHDGTHEPSGLDFAAFLRSQVLDRRPNAISIAEAGGTREQIAPWLRNRRCHWGYDFGLSPAIIYSLIIGNWEPLRDYLLKSPLIDRGSRWLLFLGAHDELQLRYSEYRDEIIKHYGGRDNEFVVFGGNGLRRRLATLIPASIMAYILVHALILTLEGVPLLYQGDLERHEGNPDAPERFARRDAMVWKKDDPLHGWSEHPPEHMGFAQDAAYTAFDIQLANPASPFNQIRRLIELRNQLPALQFGDQILLASSNPSILSYTRTTHDHAVIIAVNATNFGRQAEIDLTAYRGKRLAQFIMDPRAYAPSDDIKWKEVSPISYTGASHHLLELGPYETFIAIPF